MPLKFDINNYLFKQMAYNDVVYNKMLKTYNVRLLKSYKIASVQINKDLAQLYATLGENPSFFEAQKFNRLVKLQKNIKEELRKLGVAELNIDKKAIKESTLMGYTRSAYAYENGLNVSINFALLSKDALNAALINPLSLIKWDDSVKKNISELNIKINGKISEGMVRGQSYKDVASEIEKTIVEVTKGQYRGAVAKAMRIASTETHRAFHLGSDIAYDKMLSSADRLGAKPHKVWMSTLDNRTRDTHATIDGTKSNDDGMFELFGAEFSSPGNSGIVGEDINCRCTYVAEIDELTHSFRRDGDGKIIKNVPYYEWYENKYKRPYKGVT